MPYGNQSLEFDFDYGIDPAIDMEIYESGSLFHTNSTDFDKKETSQSDLSVIVPSAAGRLTAIEFGTSTLSRDQDYTVTEGVYSTEYTLKKEYLAALPVGENYFTLHYSNGVTSELAIQVNDSVPPLSTTKAGFNKSELISPRGDVAIEANTRDRAVEAILYGDSPLIPNQDYTVTANDHKTTYYIKKPFLMTLPTGKHEFKFQFDKGEDSILTLLVKDSTPLLGKSSIGFDKKTGSDPNREGVTVYTSGRSLSSIAYGSNLLTEGQDFTYSDAVYFYNAFLHSLPAGFNKLVFTFDTGETAELIIEVYNTTESPVLNTTRVQYDKNAAEQEAVIIAAYTRNDKVSYVKHGSTKLVNLIDYVGIQKYYITEYELSKDYLASLPVGENRLDFHKDDNTVLESLIIDVKETVPEVSIDWLRGLIDSFSSSGDLKGSLVTQLQNSLKQAEQQWNKGSYNQASKHMQDFLKHLNRTPNQQNITEEARAVLAAGAQDLIAMWSN